MKYSDKLANHVVRFINKCTKWMNIFSLSIYLFYLFIKNKLENIIISRKKFFEKNKNSFNTLIVKNKKTYSGCGDY